jgi:CDP-diglyceride synthetase
LLGRDTPVGELAGHISPEADVGSFLLGAVGLAVLASGLVAFFYPKPPPLDFSAFLGANRRLYASLICIFLGGVIALLGFWGR